MLSIVLSSEKVAAALAESLAAAAPEGVFVRAVAAEVHVLAGVDEWAASNAPAILDDPQGWADGEEDVLLETVACSTLGGVQDAISEACGRAWPPVAGDPDELAEPGARVSDGVLHLWFGNPTAPDVDLTPVPLDALA